jgi:hypothetical protein
VVFRQKRIELQENKVENDGSRSFFHKRCVYKKHPLRREKYTKTKDEYHENSYEPNDLSCGRILDER